MIEATEAIVSVVSEPALGRPGGKLSCGVVYSLLGHISHHHEGVLHASHTHQVVHLRHHGVLRGSVTSSGLLDLACSLLSHGRGLTIEGLVVGKVVLTSLRVLGLQNVVSDRVSLGL